MNLRFMTLLILLSCMVSKQTAAVLPDAESNREGMAQGKRAMVDEIILYANEWHFDFSDVQAETRLWHGREDSHIPIHLGQRIAEMLPDCKAEYFDGLGYYMIFEKWDEILSFLAKPAVTESTLNSKAGSGLAGR